MAALLGALPLALGHGTGSEMRRPLGITIIGGLIVSQSQTLFTTPVVYLYFDRLQHFISRVRKGSAAAARSRWGRRHEQAGQSRGRRTADLAGRLRSVRELQGGAGLQAARGSQRSRVPRSAAAQFQGSRGAGLEAIPAGRRVPEGQVVGGLQRPGLERPGRTGQHFESELSWQAEATYREAKAAVSVARAGLFPTVTTHAGDYHHLDRRQCGRHHHRGVRRSRDALASSICRSAATWEPDIWGNMRRPVTAASATAQASGGDLENAKLLYQSELAQDYFGLRGDDARSGSADPHRGVLSGVSDADAQPLQRRRGLGPGCGAGRIAAVRGAIAVDRSGRAAGAV